MENIFLISHTKCENIRQINVCEIKFCKFSVDLSEFDALVITSKNSINALKFNGILPTNLDIFAIGKSSAKSAKEFGFSQIYTAKNSHGDEFSAEISPFLIHKKTLFLRAKTVVSNVSEILAKNGVNLRQIVAYENQILTLSKDEILAQIPPKNSVLIFTSPSNVQGFLHNFRIDKSYKLIAIGKASAKMLENFPNLIVSSSQNILDCVKIARNLISNH